ncbi:hypothetical protein ASA1KI_22050 [Opitutales bacterium ASA1]|uniref:DUF134 domain-containing protein n=1 Tax=Congregicoccus parvus TaxID=3081749 RepID=UPI002B315B0C|nr:hypothetical protein ASA1KI_22050 [Opitutales bacterium ASA1]
MPRPPSPRRITHAPPAVYFKPAGIPIRDLDEIELGADELEALRLADVEDLYHTDAAARMAVSRQTFDRIVRRAHVKIATALVHGHALRILRPVANPVDVPSRTLEPPCRPHPTARRKTSRRS